MLGKINKSKNIIIIGCLLSISLVSLILLIRVGLYNPYGRVDYFIYLSGWSPNGNQLEMLAHFPDIAIYRIDVEDGTIQQITTPSFTTNSNQVQTISEHVLTEEFDLVERFGELREFIPSPDGNRVALVTSNQIEIFLFNLDSEMVYILDSGTGDILFESNRAQLLRITNFDIFPLVLPIWVYEISAFLTGLTGIAGLIKYLLQKRRTLVIIQLAILFFICYGCCAFNYMASWAG
jgi:hypothetical protein